MELMPDDIRASLLEAGIAHRDAIEELSEDEAVDYILSQPPLLKLTIVEPRRAWLILNLCPKNSNLAYRLIDLGTGVPKTGYINLYALTSAYDTFGLALTRDPLFQPQGSLGDYALEALLCGQIVELPTSLDSSRAPHDQFLTDEEVTARAEHNVAVSDTLTLPAITVEGERKAAAFLREIYEQNKRGTPPTEDDS